MKDNSKETQKKNTSVFSSRPVRYVLATAAVIITLLVISTIFILRIYFRTEAECYDHLLIETEEAIDGLEANFRSDRMTLRIIAGLIGNAGDMNSRLTGISTAFLVCIGLPVCMGGLFTKKHCVGSAAFLLYLLVVLCGVPNLRYGLQFLFYLAVCTAMLLDWGLRRFL